jgi:hypothetical protein
MINFTWTHKKKYHCFYRTWIRGSRHFIRYSPIMEKKVKVGVEETGVPGENHRPGASH